MEEFTAAHLADIRGVPGNAIVLIHTPDGPKRLRTIVGGHAYEKDGEWIVHQAGERYALVLHTDPDPPR